MQRYNMNYNYKQIRMKRKFDEAELMSPKNTCYLQKTSPHRDESCLSATRESEPVYSQGVLWLALASGLTRLPSLFHTISFSLSVFCVLCCLMKHTVPVNEDFCFLMNNFACFFRAEVGSLRLCSHMLLFPPSAVVPMV